MAGLLSNLEVPTTTSVSDKVAEITSQENPLMKQAKSSGLQTAAGRGLLNSSIAAGAAQNAVISAATPMAQQDVQQEFQAKQNAANQNWQAGENTLAREQEKALQQQQQTWQSGETALSREQEKALQQTEQTWKTEQTALDRALQEKLNTSNLAAAEREAASNLLTSMDQLYEQSYYSIMANTNLTATQRDTYLKDAKALREKRLGLLEQMYSINIDW